MQQSKGDTKLRVLQICEATNAGVGRHTMDLCNGLLESGCDVHLIYSKKRIDDGFEYQLKRLPSLKTAVVDMRRGPHFSDFPAIRKIRAYIKNNGPFDIIHGQSSKGGALARLVSTAGRTPIVYTPNCISTMAPTFGKFSRVSYGLIERLLAKPTSIIICTSPDELEHIHALGVPRDKLRLIYYGIELPPETDRDRIRASNGLDPSALIVGFVGRLSAQKNPEMLIRAFADVARDIPQARLAIIGIGELETQLKTLAKDVGISDQIDWLGYRIGYHTMPAFDILAVPSRYDTGPIVMMEAMALGIPIVITNVGCVRYVMKHEESGFVVEPNDLKGFSNSLHKLLTSAETRVRIAAAASEKAIEFKHETMIDKTLTVYRDAIASKVRTAKASK
jgi:glycosyltransferase involved in cell wall biosynthesis